MKPQCHAPRLTAVLWGRAVENETHCDFVKLREMLIRVNMEDLREQTHARHYELYRRCKLEEMGFKDTDPESKPVRWDSWTHTHSHTHAHTHTHTRAPSLSCPLLSFSPRVCVCVCVWLQ